VAAKAGLVNPIMSMCECVALAKPVGFADLFGAL
jgi:hypothetical protein